MPAVLVIGGGIAGTAAALALGKAAIGATVYEAQRTPANQRPAGASEAINAQLEWHTDLSSV
jgi:2-polyprenyl-6-methoxyphenol hydroxylase-like FAD-dependent oxidoreductase